MCGIAGVWNRQGDEAPGPVCERIRDRMTRRGPDDAGLWVDGGLALGQRRLAILDLSPTGHQPMSSASGRWEVVFNGEIYNHHELRQVLGARSWRGTSDTEVLAAALDQWGFVGALARLRGMFAILAWDREERALWGARDRLGQKPFYYHHGSRRTLVASELRALRPEVGSTWDAASLAHLVRFGHVPSPRSILEEVQQLQPGCWVRFDARGGVTTERYWDPTALAAQAPRWATYREACDGLETLLRGAVRSHAEADVPLGILLSGGVDSSLVAALLTQEVPHIRTFTIGVDDPEMDESEAAAKLAGHLGTRHTALRLRVSDLTEQIGDLMSAMDEPLGDASIVPTHLVARLAREHVTVVLSGDGGDELFGGYERYRRTLEAWRLVEAIPTPARRAAGAAASWAARWQAAGIWGPQPRLVMPVRRLEQTGSTTLAALYQCGLSNAVAPLQYLSSDLKASATSGDTGLPVGGVRSLMMADLQHYLPDEVLVKVDRAAMWASLETRAPLLDHLVAEAALSLPEDWTWNGGQGKRILKDILGRHVPKAMVDRPKRGFGFPIASWLRAKQLRPWAEELLTADRLTATGIWNVQAVRRAWIEHQRGANHEKLLWTILVTQFWSGAKVAHGGAA